MAGFKEMDPDLIRKHLEGHKDVITAEIEKENDLFRRTECPICGSNQHEVRLKIDAPFSPNTILPRKNLICTKCGTEFDPYTGVTIRSSSDEVNPFSSR